MFRRLVIALAACIFSSALWAPLTAHAQQGPSWRVLALTGHVQISDGERSRQAQLNEFVPYGAAVTTGAQSTATIGNGAQIITMSANSRMSIPSNQPSGMTRVRQTLGSILFQIDHRTAPHFRVDTPLLAAIVKGTTFTVVVDREGETVTVADYQVKVAARQQRIMGAEALMRWRHPEHGEIAPDKFIPVAEETGAIDQLTRWALKQVIADQLYLRAQGIDLRIALNVSGRSLSDLAFSAHVAHEVRKSGALLCVEITETAVIADPLVAVSSIAVLKEAGVRVAIDDYGAGLSSLSYLKEIAADELKLDKSLIKDTAASARDRLIVKSTIDLAHGLGMMVVAEGVEDEATCALLAAAGCDCVQGYLFSQPAAVGEIAELCARVGVGDAQVDAALAVRGR